MHYFLGAAEGEREDDSRVKEKPVTITVGIPGFNAQIPLVSKQRFWLALGLSVVAGVAGSFVLSKWLNKAQG